MNYIPPPTEGDILFAAKSMGWPRRQVAGVSVGPGENSWRQTVAGMSADARARFWSGLGALASGRSVRSLPATDQGGPGRVAARPYTRVELQPSPAELAVFMRAVVAAKEHGLILKTDACRFAWFDRDSLDEATGVIDSSSDPPTIHLARGLSEGELAETVVHELAHLADLQRLGREQYRAMPAAVKEERARAWTFAVLGWIL